MSSRRERQVSSLARNSSLTHGEFRLPRPSQRPEDLTTPLLIRPRYSYIEGNRAKFRRVVTGSLRKRI